jgi:hypothetical protein
MEITEGVFLPCISFLGISGAQQRTYQVMLGRVVALYHRSPTSYQLHDGIRCLPF